MQAITPVTADQLLAPGQEPLMKFEILFADNWVGTMNFDSGSIEPEVDEILTGATSGATAKVVLINRTAGTWGGGDAVGSISLKECSGCFHDNENINGSIGGANILTVNHPDEVVGVDKSIKNGAFVHDVDPPNGWSAGNSADLTTEAGGKITNCLMVTENGESNPYAYQDKTVIPGEIYRLKCYVKEGTEANYSVRIYDIDNAAYILNVTREEIAGDWSTEETYTFKVPADCTNVRIVLMQLCDAAAGTTIYFDEISFYNFEEWIDLCTLDDKNYLKNISISLGGAGMTPDPVAGSWSAVIANENNIFYPDHPSSLYIDYFHIGRKVRISLGSTYGGTDYYWQRMIGYMQEPRFSIDNTEVELSGFDYMQYLADTELRKPDNYWGELAILDSVATTQFGDELYDPPGGDAAEIGGGEADNVLNWAVKTNGGTLVSSEDDLGGFSDYEVQFRADPDDPPAGSRIWYEGVCDVVAGQKYNVAFKYARIAGDGNLRFSLYDGETLVGGTGSMRAPTNDVFYSKSFSFTPSADATLDLKLFSRVADGPTIFRIDQISIQSVASNVIYRYQMPDACKGIHYVEFDEGEGFVPVWPGRRKDGDEGWFYDPVLNQFYFAEEKIVAAGVANLKIYYYTQQVLDNVVADLMVEAKLYSNRSDALTAMDYTATTQAFEVLDSHVVGENRANQGVAKDEDGNFYVFSHDVTIDETFYYDLVTKYDSDWNYVDEYGSLDGKVDGGATVWIFGDGNVIDGKLYVALRTRYSTEGAIGIWDLDLNFESLHPIEGGSPEEIEKRDGFYWIIYGSAGDRSGSIEKYSLTWVHQNTYNLTEAYGYDGFAWKDGQIYCNGGGCSMDVYKFDGSAFTFFYQIDSLGDEGFCLDGEIFYFAGEENDVVWEGAFAGKIDKVWFEAGKPALDAINLICERLNYRFHFSHDGRPVFKPAPSAKIVGSEDFSFCQCHIAEVGENQDKSELRNRVVIEGIKVAAPEGEEETRPSELKGEAADDAEGASIDTYGEHTKTIKNHLFQTQTVIDIYKAIYLAAFKDPKWYDSWNTPYNPVPLEFRDTVRWQVRLTPPSGYGKAYSTFKYGDGTKYGANGIIIIRRGLIRDIKIENFNVQYVLEKAI